MGASVALLFAQLLSLFLLSGAVSNKCNGTQWYRFVLTMDWSKQVDPFFPRDARFPVVFIVAHNDDYHLFRQGSILSPGAMKMLQGPNIDTLRAEVDKAIREKKVKSYDKAWDATPQSRIDVSVQLDGDINATKVSVMGRVFPSPDWFFGHDSLQLCDKGTFVRKQPTIKLLSWDGGFDNGKSYNSPPTILREPLPVAPLRDLFQKRIRGELIKTFDYGVMETSQGTLAGYFPFWKSLLIAGILAIALLTLVICLYPRCCKKRTLDVPVPLQDESQWST